MQSGKKWLTGDHIQGTNQKGFILSFLVEINNSFEQRSKYTTGLITYDLPDSLASLKKSEMCNLNTNVIFYDFWFYIKVMK